MWSLSLCIWFYIQRPKLSYLMLLWPALYALHAIFILAGGPTFRGQWDFLNFAVPTVGYGLLSAVIAQLYSRYALFRLKRLVQETRAEGWRWPCLMWIARFTNQRGCGFLPSSPAYRACPTISKDSLGLTKGNLGSHLNRLERAGFIKVRKSFQGRMPCTDYFLTQAGRVSLATYWSTLDEIRGAARSR